MQPDLDEYRDPEQMVELALKQDNLNLLEHLLSQSYIIKELSLDTLNALPKNDLIREEIQNRLKNK